MTSFFDQFRRGGRYRFRRGQPIDPMEGLHPELVDPQLEFSSAVPQSPEALIAMQHQDVPDSERPTKPDRSSKETAKARQALDLIKELETTAADDLQIALALVRQLEEYHDNVVRDLHADPEANHAQITAWSVDADRLMHCRVLIDSIELQ